MRSTRGGHRGGAVARIATVTAVVVGALSLVGCSADPDLAPLESRLAEVPGVNGAFTWVTHSGAPWNTQVQVLLFVDEPTESGLVDAVRGAAPVIADDAAASRHPVGIWFVDGDRADYADRDSASADAMAIFPSVFETLGLDGSGGRMITVGPDDIERIASGR